MKKELFTQRIQLVWIAVLVVALVGIGQAFNFKLYQISVVVMFGAGMSQIAIGNVPPTAPPARFFKFLGIFAVAIVAIFTISIVSIPYLVNLGR